MQYGRGVQLKPPVGSWLAAGLKSQVAEPSPPETLGALRRTGGKGTAVDEEKKNKRTLLILFIEYLLRTWYCVESK